MDTLSAGLMLQPDWQALSDVEWVARALDISRIEAADIELGHVTHP